MSTTTSPSARSRTARPAVVAASAVAPERVVLHLSVVIGVLAAIAAGAGALLGGGPGQHVVTTIRGDAATLYGVGLYRYDTFLVGAGNRGTDVATLLFEIPILAAAAAGYRRASLRAALVLCGALSYFLYYYASLTFATAYNRLLPLYIALMSASLFALVATFGSIDAGALAERFPARPSRSAIGRYLYAVAGLLVLVWGSSLVPALVTGTAPGTVATYTSETTWALDLGLIVPVALLAAVLLRQGSPRGVLLATVTLALNVAFGVALIAQTAAQLVAGVELSAGEIIGKSVSFALLTAVAAWLFAGVLRGLAREGRMA